MKPPMPYSGGKQRLADWIVSLLPEHDTYVEPFAGGLSVLLAKVPSGLEVVNDINRDLITFWRVLRDQPDELARVCALTPHSREEARLCGSRAGWSDLERARRVWVCLTQHRAAVMRDTAGWRHVYASNGMPISRYLDGYLARIAPAAQRLRHVSLESRPAIDIIRAYGRPNTLFYLDPPYLGAVRGTSSRQYVHEMTSEREHTALLDAITTTPAMVAISGYAHPLYDSALDGWNRHQTRTTSAMGSTRTETLWTNYPTPGLLPIGAGGVS